MRGLFGPHTRAIGVIHDDPEYHRARTASLRCIGHCCDVRRARSATQIRQYHRAPSRVRLLNFRTLRSRCARSRIAVESEAAIARRSCQRDRCIVSEAVSGAVISGIVVNHTDGARMRTEQSAHARPSHHAAPRRAHILERSDVGTKATRIAGKFFDLDRDGFERRRFGTALAKSRRRRAEARYRTRE